jgi:hypothetical protein
LEQVLQLVTNSNKIGRPKIGRVTGSPEDEFRSVDAASDWLRGQNEDRPNWGFTPCSGAWPPGQSQAKLVCTLLCQTR